MGVTCDILLTNNTQGVYRAGQEVQGLVRYTIEKATEFTSITLSLKGHGSCRWLGGLNHIGSTCIGTEDYIDQRIDLLEAIKAAIGRGTYEKEFRFVLPETIPSSYKDIRCFIEYFIELVFLFENGKRFSKKIDVMKVQGGVQPRLEQQPARHQVIAKTFNSNESITLNAEIENTHWNPGKVITVKLGVKNFFAECITIMSELIEYITYKSNCNHEKQTSNTVNGAELNITAEKMDDTQIYLQKIATTPDMFTINSNILTRNYAVKVVFKLSSLHKGVNIDIPIVIAEEIEVSKKVEPVDLPPSYSQVMNPEEK